MSRLSRLSPPFTDTQVVASTLVLALLVAVIKPVSTAYVRARTEKHGLNARPLHDVATEVLPDLSHLYWVGDALVAGLIVFGVAYLFSTGRTSLLWRVLWVVVAAHAIKVVTVGVTILPDPSGMCEYKQRGWRRLLGTCNDLLPSGHMIILFATAFLTRGVIPGPLWTGLCALTAATWFITLASKNHYTVDTLVSLLTVAALAPCVTTAR